MIVDINSLANGSCVSVSLSKFIEVSPEFNLNDNKVFVELSGKICKTLKYYSFDGFLKANLSLCCSKCLCELSYPLDILVNEKFSNTENIVQIGKNDSSIEGDNGNDEFLDIWKFSGHSIDLSEMAESNLFLNIPYKVLCKENCKGLCCVCGCDLNVTDCSCKNSHSKDELENKTKNKFEALRSLFKE